MLRKVSPKFSPPTMDALYSGLQRLELPNRDSRLPQLYSTDSHPLIKGEHGKIIIMVQDSSTSAMAENLDAASEMEVPATKSENDEMGQ